MQVDFVIECVDSSGIPTGKLREVTSVLLVDVDGRVVGTFWNANTLIDSLQTIEDYRIVANDKVGPPRSDLFGRVICHGDNCATDAES